MKPFLIITLMGLVFMVIQQSFPRGIRNNNPGNIRRNTIQWEGMKHTQSDDDFVQFVAPIYDFRAMTRILRSYERHGLVTVREIINTYVPSTENHTQAYIHFVTNRLNISPDQELNLTVMLLPLIKAITAFENGSTFIFILITPFRQALHWHELTHD